MSPAPDALSTTFAALADPTRRAILARLAKGESTVTELAEPFDMSLPAITKHLKVLERAGLVSRSRDAQRRPCKLEAAPLREATDWIAAYAAFWEESFDRLEGYLAELGAGGAPESASPPSPSPKKRIREKRPHANRVSRARRTRTEKKP